MIGGYGDGGWTATVELFQVKTRRWYELTNIPRPLTLPSATICGNQLHVIGWPCLPVTQSTAASLYGQLVIIGGLRFGSLANSIHQLVDGKWVKIGSMSSNRKMCLVVSPSPDRMMIVVGEGARGSVEECIVMSP